MGLVGVQILADRVAARLTRCACKATRVAVGLIVEPVLAHSIATDIGGGAHVAARAAVVLIGGEAYAESVTASESLGTTGSATASASRGTRYRTWRLSRGGRCSSRRRSRRRGRGWRPGSGGRGGPPRGRGGGRTDLHPADSQTRCRTAGSLRRQTGKARRTTSLFGHTHLVHRTALVATTESEGRTALRSTGL
jgi:hypothetical protein